MNRMLGPTMAVAFLLAGCASHGSLSDRPIAPAPVREYSHDGLRFVSLGPLPVGEMRTIQDGAVSLYVGALYAGSGEVDKGEHTLALVLRSVSRDGVPVLTSGTDLLLDVDGTYVASNPRPGGHTYQVEGTDGGVAETVMVPLTPELLRKLSQAQLVRGRLGPWFSFVLPRAQRAALAGILDEIPVGVRYRTSRPLPGIIASQ